MFVKVGFGPLVQTLRDPGGTQLFNYFSTKKWFLKGKLILEHVLKKKVNVVHQNGKVLQNTIQINKNVWKTTSRFNRFASRYAVATVARELRNRAGMKILKFVISNQSLAAPRI